MSDVLKTIPVVAETKSACCGPECCSDTPAAETIAAGSDVRTVVREKYGAVADGTQNSCGCCAPGDVDAVMLQLGYTKEQAAALPEGANLGLGCGNPLAHASLRAGEVVLDLGSGAGIDCFLAAREVGPTGKVIGVDMTASMLERARANAAKANITNVEFRLGEIEHLPVVDGSVDVIISNCVVNLSPDKPQVFAEAFRALKSGGRLMLSDLVLTKPLSPALQNNVSLYVGCVAGASVEGDYLRMISEAGFASVEVQQRGQYTVGMDTLPADSPEREAFESVVSVKVRAIKP